MDDSSTAERQCLYRKIRLRTLVLHQQLERQAASDENAAAMLELVDDISVIAGKLEVSLVKLPA